MLQSSPRGGVGTLCIAIVVLVIAVGAGSAHADGDLGDPNPLPNTPDVASAIGAGTELDDEELTDPGAAAGVPLEDLDRDEAQALLSGVFGDVVEAPSGIYDELQEAEILAPDVAVLPAAATSANPVPEGEGASEAEAETPRSAEETPPSSPAELASGSLIQSTVPLQVEDGAGHSVPVDLTLGKNEGGLQPVAPLVDVRIPDELGDGIALPDLGITVEIAEVPDGRSPSVTDDNAAFFPNVAPNADFAVAPAPSGFETFSQLRDPKAPTTQVYELSLPNDAILAETDDGGAEVVREGEKLLAVQPPVAIDAAGSDVPVALEVDGDSLIVSADPPQGAAFPILVDPLWQSYEWSAKNTTAGICSSSTGSEPGGSCNNREEWGYDVFVNNWGGLPHLRVDNGWGPAQPGIFVTAEQQQRAGDHAAVIYTVPRYFKESPPPTSYIKQLNVSNVTWQALGASASPYLFMGIWDYVNQGWIKYFSHTGQVEHGINDPAFVYEFKNEQPNKNGKVAQVGIWATEASAGSNARVYAGSASVELGDSDAPQAPAPSGQSAWSDKAAVPVSFTASDTGLGVYAINVSTGPNNPAGAFTWKQKQGCVGIGNAACPQTWKSSDAGSPAVTFDPSVLPNGLNYVALIAEDPVGNKSASSWAEVRVDHTAPQLSLSGNLTEQGTAGTNLREYTLNYTAKDGDDAAATALTPWGVAGKAEKQLERPMGVAIASDGSIYAVDRVNNRVIKYDTEGKPVLQIGSTGSGDGQFNDPRGIDIAPDGTVWVADMGNDRIQAFSPTGTFLRKAKFTDPASEPYAIASGPGGVLWVTDIGLHRLVKVSENPITTLLITTGKEPGIGGKGTAVIAPTGVATDRFGNVWIADGGLGKVLELDSAGKPLFQFGTGGSGDGQIDGIVGIDVSPAGNIAITERNNGRVQIFKPDGSYLRKFGSTGTGNNQFSEAGGLSFGPDNMLAVADAGNKRVTRWSHADQDPQSGASKVVIKVDGVTVQAKEPGCATKNCQVSGNWTLDADEFAGGAHKVEVVATDAVGITQTRTLDIETHGDHTDPAIALSGTMTEQASFGTTRPNYRLRAVATDSGPTAELKSGVATTVIKVDGATVDSSSPGCPGGECSITREWTLNSGSYSVGSHTVEVKATDAAGRVSTKTLTIDIARDTTPPAVSYNGAFYSAPSGWLEQKKVGYTAYATDNGYGVTSVEMKIDGAPVNSTSQTCVEGGCAKYFGFAQTLDMSKYSGGAHPAEFIARDGAGNVHKRTWTINVDPEGHISASEAEDTLEALEHTSEGNPIGPSQEEVGVDGTASGLTLIASQQGLTAEGTEVPLGISTSPGGSLSMEILPSDAFSNSCVSEGFEVESESESIASPECDLQGGFVGANELTAVSIDPIAISENAGAGAIVNNAASISVNTSHNVDTITRPLYDGALTFKALRDTSAPETFSWQVGLGEGQVMQSIDSRHVMVYYGSGHEAFSIVAEPAHDAVGTEVPTTLDVSSSNEITLTVHHHVSQFVYPILAGAGWQGGFTSVEIEGPMDEQEIREEQERIEQEEREALEALEAGGEVSVLGNLEGSVVHLQLFVQGPPVYRGTTAEAKPLQVYSHKFKFNDCRYTPEVVETNGGTIPPERREGTRITHCVNGNDDRELLTAESIHGHFNISPGVFVSIDDPVQCDKWGPEQPKKINCAKRVTRYSDQGWREQIEVFGNFRFPPQKGAYYVGPTSACVTVRGTINRSPKVLRQPATIFTPARAGTEEHPELQQPCNWP